MRIEFSYPVTTSLFLTESWPVKAGDFLLDWLTEKGLVTDVAITVPMSDADILPSVQPSDDPGKKLNINVGHTARQDEVEQFLRTVQGLLSLFSSIEIDFGRVQISWKPENEEEEKALELYSFQINTEKFNPDQPSQLDFNLVTQSVTAAVNATHFEIPLSFMRRGNRDIHASRYIEAYYNLFFFLETLYAPGHSNSKKVMEKFKSAGPIRNAITTTRKRLSQNSPINTPKLKTLLGMTEEELIEHIVKLRGNLHHHALPRAGAWHPEKAEEFKEDTLLLQHLVHDIAIAEVWPLIFADEQREQIMQNAREAGAIVKVRVEPIGLIDGEAQDLESLVFQVPGYRVTRNIIDRVNQEFRGMYPGGIRDTEILGYKIVSEDRAQVYATYDRPFQPEHTQSS